MISVENAAGHRMTRNSSQMKTINRELVGKQPEIPENDPGDEEICEESARPNPPVGLTLNRPTRERRPPAYLQDYVRR